MILADVAPDLIHGRGAVSSGVAGALARGARARLGAKIGLGITGIAGPGGATPGKNVGLTYVAVDSDGYSAVKKYEWPYDREGNRLASVGAALDLLGNAIPGGRQDPASLATRSTAPTSLATIAITSPTPPRSPKTRDACLSRRARASTRAEGME